MDKNDRQAWEALYPFMNNNRPSSIAPPTMDTPSAQNRMSEDENEKDEEIYVSE